MSNANEFGIECVKIVHELNLKAAKFNYQGYPVLSIDYYAKMYNYMVKLGATPEQLEKSIIDIATGEFK